MNDDGGDDSEWYGAKCTHLQCVATLCECIVCDLKVHVSGGQCCQKVFDS